MKRVLCVIGLALVLAMLALAWFARPYMGMPKGATTISLWLAADTFKQCSRNTPAANAPYWIPTTEEIQVLEANLWHTLEERDKQGLRVPYKFMQYHRQYIGFTRNGERLIYGNFYTPDQEMTWEDWMPYERPVNMCDGGRHYWGIVHLRESRTFEELQFNGQ